MVDVFANVLRHLEHDLVSVAGGVNLVGNDLELLEKLQTACPFLPDLRLARIPRS